MNKNPVVGHKTIRTSEGPVSVPLHKNEADAIMAAIAADKKRRLELMPDEQAALSLMFDVRERLRELGWREAIYSPKDGTVFEALEFGSSGIHKCRYDGEWPNGRYWILADGDLWPSRPIMFRLIKE